MNLNNYLSFYRLLTVCNGMAMFVLSTVDINGLIGTS